LAKKVEAHSEIQSLLDESFRRSSAFTKKIMPKRLAAREVVSFINHEKNAVFATSRKDGFPHTAWNPIVYVDKKLYTYADPNSVFYRNLKRDGRVALAITSGNKAVFIEGVSREVAQVRSVIDTLLADIRSVVKDWIPDSSYNYATLNDCQASIFEIEPLKILSYSGSSS
jgi:uncharacterized pyridoxamine 5'-phosphate oxidase family protein